MKKSLFALFVFLGVLLNINQGQAMTCSSQVFDNEISGYQSLDSDRKEFVNNEGLNKFELLLIRVGLKKGNDYRLSNNGKYVTNFLDNTVKGPNNIIYFYPNKKNQQIEYLGGDLFLVGNNIYYKNIKLSTTETNITYKIYDYDVNLILIGNKLFIDGVLLDVFDTSTYARQNIEIITRIKAQELLANIVNGDISYPNGYFLKRYNTAVPNILIDYTKPKSKGEKKPSIFYRGEGSIYYRFVYYNIDGKVLYITKASGVCMNLRTSATLISYK